jgi:hypothetical protein
MRSRPVFTQRPMNRCSRKFACTGLSEAHSSFVLSVLREGPARMLVAQECE